MLRNLCCALCAGFFLAVGGGVNADSISAAFNNVYSATSPQNSSYLNGLLISASFGTTNLGSGYIGQYNWTQTSGTPLLASGPSFFTYCIEITQDIGPGGQYVYDLGDPQYSPKPASIFTGTGMGFDKAQQIAALWAIHVGLTPGVDLLTGINDQAAFQIAVWEIEYGSTLAITVLDDAARNTSINTTASGWVNQVTSTTNPYSGSLAHLIALNSDDVLGPPRIMGAQDQITAVAGPLPGTPTPTPLPATVSGGLGLLACVGLWRFKGRFSVGFAGG